MEELQPKETTVFKQANADLDRLDKKTLITMRIVGWAVIGGTFAAGVFTGRKSVTQTPKV